MGPLVQNALYSLHLEISSAEQTLAKDCHIFAANGDTHFKLVAPLPPVDTHFVTLYVSVIDQYPNLSANSIFKETRGPERQQGINKEAMKDDHLLAARNQPRDLVEPISFT